MKLVLFAIGVVSVVTPTVLGVDVFYDRFDTYCAPPKDANGLCTGDTARSDPQLRAVWNWSSWNYNTNQPDGSNMVLEDNEAFLYTAPYGARCANGGDEGGRLGHNTVNLVPYIGTVYPNNNVVNGTDLNPLILNFYFSGGIAPANGVRYSNGYMELALDDAYSPTDFVWVGDDQGPDPEGCYTCFNLCPSPHFSVHVPWRTICQQYEPRTVNPGKCPDPQTNTRACLSIGALSMLDNNPCHCENPADQVPQNDHLSYYDGWKWRSIRSGMFPGSGDFTLGDKYNHVILTIKTNTVDIYHYTRTGTNPNVWTTSTATGVPRLYLGGFNKLRGGTSEACELNNGSYTCTGPRRPMRMGDTRCDGGGWQTNKSKFISFDRVRLSDGVPGNIIYTGACCLPDGECAIASQSECDAVGGTYNGDGTLCENAQCCPIPFGDTDEDGDMDQIDFGRFQLCFTGDGGSVLEGCRCFNRDGDNDVDALDFTAFSNCWSGPNVALDVNNPPAGCNP